MCPASVLMMHDKKSLPVKNVLETREGEKGRSISWYLGCGLASVFFLPEFQPNKLLGLVFHHCSPEFKTQQAMGQMPRTLIHSHRHKYHKMGPSHPIFSLHVP